MREIELVMEGIEQMKKQLCFRKAAQEDVEVLRRLAYQSEAHWGYHESFMERFHQEFNITKAFLTEHPVFVGETEAEIVAFWGMVQNQEGCELEYFYVASSCLGEGYGKVMWQHMTDWCRNRHIPSIHFVTSPQAVGFYEKMGAVQDRMAESVIDGRMIPHFQFEINLKNKGKCREKFRIF